MSSSSSSISLDSTFAQEFGHCVVYKFQMSVGIIDLILAYVAKHETVETRLARDIWNLNIAELPWDIVNVISHYRPIQNSGRVVRKFAIQRSPLLRPLPQNTHQNTTHLVPSGFANHDEIHDEYYFYFWDDDKWKIASVDRKTHILKRVIDVPKKHGHFIFNFAVSDGKIFILHNFGILELNMGGEVLVEIPLNVGAHDIHVHHRQLIIFVQQHSKILVFDYNGIALNSVQLEKCTEYRQFAVNRFGEIYITNPLICCMEVYNLDGVLLRKFYNSRMMYVGQILFGPCDEVFVTNEKQNRVEVFSSVGEHQRTLFTSSCIRSMLLLPDNRILVASSFRSLQMLE